MSAECETGRQSLIGDGIHEERRNCETNAITIAINFNLLFYSPIGLNAIQSRVK